MRRKRKQRGEIFEVLIFVIFKELMADTKIQIQEAQKTSRLNTKKKTNKKHNLHLGISYSIFRK